MPNENERAYQHRQHSTKSVEVISNYCYYIVVVVVVVVGGDVVVVYIWQRKIHQMVGHREPSRLERCSTHTKIPINISTA